MQKLALRPDPKMERQRFILFGVFDRIVNAVVEHTPHLHRIRHKHRVLIHIIVIDQLAIAVAEIQAQFFGQIIKICPGIQALEIVRDPVRVQIGVGGQLIQKHIHLLRLVVDRRHVGAPLFRRIRHAVHQPFRIPPDRRQRCLQIVRDIGDKLPLVAFGGKPLLGVQLQPLPHLLKGHGKLRKLVLSFDLNREIQISFFYLFRACHKDADLSQYPLIDPHDQQGRSQRHDQYATDHHIRHPLAHDRRRRILRNPQLISRADAIDDDRPIHQKRHGDNNDKRNDQPIAQLHCHLPKPYKTHAVSICRRNSPFHRGTKNTVIYSNGYKECCQISYEQRNK